jgi:thiosulfate/3-mercaptopyruvate sulfurtransferase
MLQSLVTTNWLNDTLDHPDLVILYTTLIPKNGSISVEVENLQIKGAQFFDLQTIFSDQHSGLPNTFPSEKQFEENCRNLGINGTSKIVVYDLLGIYSSPRVWFLFMSMGHNNVFVLNGSLQQWVNEGYQTSILKERVSPKGNFKANLNELFIRTKSDIQENVKTEESLILDARSAVRFNGEVPESREGLRSGNIPNSCNLHYSALLNKGKYKSKNELEKLFKQYDLSKPIIFSCGSGITACILYLAASELVVNQLAVYDGSWTEWGSR